MTPELMAAARVPRRSTTVCRCGQDRVRWREASYGRVATGELDVTHGAILYLDYITVSFDGFKAERASLSISAGEMRCIIGPTGRQDDDDGLITGRPGPTWASLLRLDLRPAALRRTDRVDRHRASSRSTCSSSSACSRLELR